MMIRATKRTSDRKHLTLCWSCQLLVLAIFVSNSRTDANILSTFQQYENIRANATNVTRVKSIDVVETENGNIPFCHLAMVMPFSRVAEEREAVDLGVFQGQASVMLAIEHLNTGNGTMVKEVEGLNQRCPIKFTAEIFDSAYSQTAAVDTVINLVARQPGTERLPCAFLGARWSSVSIPSSTVTGLKGYPQISPISTSARLDDKGQFPLFGRTIPSDASTAVPAILYLRNQLGVKHLAIAHVNDAYGAAYALGLQVAAETYAPDMKVQSFSFEFYITDEIVERTIRQVKETNYRYIFGIFFSDVQYVPMMTEAYNQGIAGTGEHSWMFSDSVSPTFFNSQDFDVDSKVYKASMGASRIAAVAGVEGSESFDTFFRSVNDLNNDEDIALIQSKHPTYDDPAYQPLRIEDNRDSFFDGFQSSTLVPFLYDAAIGLGLAACDAARDDTYFDGNMHYETFKNTTFAGATGQNAYYQETGSRQANSATFIMMNVIEKERTGNMATLSLDVSDVFETGEWDSLKTFVFNDGSTTPHSDLPPLEADMNYIGWIVRGVGLVMSSLILAFSVGLYFWTSANRKTKVVKASQPMFLHMICGGCFLMALSIIFLSIDDEVASENSCTATCITTPWFFCIGWIVAFSALFAKTLRVNKIFHNPVAFSRIKVTMWDVIKPVVALLSTTVLILLLWTVLNPPVFTRRVSALDVYGRDKETKGTCDYTDSLPYAISLLVVLVGTLVYAVQQAYVARNISTEFAETEYIFLVLVAIFVTALLGIPVLLLVAGNPAARFFAVATIIFLCNLAILCLIFIPKIKQRRKEVEAKKNGTNGNFRKQTFTVGSQRLSVSGIQLDSEADTSESNGEDLQESLEEDDGMKIIDTPKKVDKLEQQIESLRLEIDMLRKRKQVTRLPSLHEASEEHKDEVEEELDEVGSDQMSAGGSGNHSVSSGSSHPLRVDMTGKINTDENGAELDV